MGQNFDDYSDFQKIPGMPILLQHSVYLIWKKKYVYLEIITCIDNFTYSAQKNQAKYKFFLSSSVNICSEVVANCYLDPNIANFTRKIFDF